MARERQLQLSAHEEPRDSRSGAQTVRRRRVQKSRWYGATGVQYVADLYTAVGDNPKKESYVLWNLRGQYRIAKWVDVWVRGDNLLAQKYEINDGYPMPRVTVMAGFRFNF